MKASRYGDTMYSGFRFNPSTDAAHVESYLNATFHKPSGMYGHTSLNELSKELAVCKSF